MSNIGETAAKRQRRQACRPAPRAACGGAERGLFRAELTGPGIAATHESAAMTGFAVNFCIYNHIMIRYLVHQEDYELELLLSLDGLEFQFARGYRVKIAAQRIDATKTRPHGIKYSLTLHDPGGQRIYGLDNAHGVRGRRPEFDHRHVHGGRRSTPYVYRGSARLLEDFYAEVERILRERGAL